MSNDKGNKPDPKPDPKPTTVIHIDKKMYKTPEAVMTGAELRRLAEPDVGENRTLWREVPGGEDDQVDDDEKVELRNGMHFYSAPKTINPG